MASIRLTNSMREIILQRLVDHGFTKQNENFVKEEQALANAVYDHLYPAKHQKAMASLPEGYLSESDDVWVAVDGERHKLNFGESRRVASSLDERRAAFLSSDPLGAKIRDFIRRRAQHQSAQKTAERETRETLRSVSTLSALVQVWPDIETFVRDMQEAKKPITALALPIRNLNLTFGLPPPKAA